MYDLTENEKELIETIRTLKRLGNDQKQLKSSLKFEIQELITKILED